MAPDVERYENLVLGNGTAVKYLAWAMGDCAGSPQFRHVAVDDFRVVYDNLNGGSRTTKNRLMPFCMYADPEVARVGRNESEARRDGIEYRLAKAPMTDGLRWSGLKFDEADDTT